jgi:hypothetical protein
LKKQKLIHVQFKHGAVIYEGHIESRVYAMLGFPNEIVWDDDNRGFSIYNVGTELISVHRPESPLSPIGTLIDGLLTALLDMRYRENDFTINDNVGESEWTQYC